MLPIAGGNITGNLGVAGTTTLTGTLTALGHSQINTLDVAGQATFADGVEIDGVDAADFATKTYVDEAVASGGLWQGTWDASTNTPDLTQTTLQRNGWGWTVVTPDPTAPFDVPATPVIPGLNGLTVYNGDHVIWSDAASTFELVSGSSISRQEAEDLFPLKEDVFYLRGVGGTYTQGTDFDGAGLPTFQAFLDGNINNRFFDAPLTLEINAADVVTDVSIRNVMLRFDGPNSPPFTIACDHQLADRLFIQNVSADVIINCDAPLMANRFYLTHVTSVSMNGDTTINTAGSRVFWGRLGLGNLAFGVGKTITSTGQLIIQNSGGILYVGDAGTVVLNNLYVLGYMLIDAAALAADVFTVAYFPSNGMIVDNRPGRPLESFARATPPATKTYMTPGQYRYVVPRAGRYEIVLAGAGGAGANWIGNPPFGTTGSTPMLRGGGCSGAISRTQYLLQAGNEMEVLIPQGTPPGITSVIGGGANSCTARPINFSFAGNLNVPGPGGPWAWSGNSGWGDVAQLPPQAGHGAGDAVTPANLGSGGSGGGALSQTLTYWDGTIYVRSGMGTSPSRSEKGGDGMAAVAWIGPT